MASISGPTLSAEGGGGGGIEGRIGVDDVAATGAASTTPSFPGPSATSRVAPSTISSAAHGENPAASPLAVR